MIEERLILNIYLKPIFMPHGCPTGHEGFMVITTYLTNGKKLE
jgi:hypothetical protein